MTDQQTPRKPASLNKALRLGFRATYDSLGYVVAASFATFLTGAIVLTIMGLLSARVKQLHAGEMFLGLVALPVVWLCAVGIFYYARKVVYHEQPAPADTWEGIRRLAVPALALFVVDLLVTTLLLGDLTFFWLAFRSKGTVVFAALGIISAYIALMWLLMSVYHLPLLIAQLEMESGPRVRVIMRKSFLLAADNPGFTVGLFVAIIAFAILCALPAMVGMAVLFPGAAAFLLTFSLRELFIRYGVVEEEPEIVEDKPWKLNI